ncbi:MAG: PP0621 family protein [Gammaproteobacteria bacterium]|nr:PP0621 family protein [Gammaproteobacteria bacterium]
MFRNLFLIAAILLVVWIIRGFIRRSQLTGAANKPRKNKDMVQCEQCKTYLPKDDAIVNNDKTFCSQQHLNDWNHKA